MFLITSGSAGVSGQKTFCLQCSEAGRQRFCLKSHFQIKTGQLYIFFKKMLFKVEVEKITTVLIIPSKHSVGSLFTKFRKFRKLKIRGIIREVLAEGNLSAYLNMRLRHYSLQKLTLLNTIHSATLDRSVHRILVRIQYFRAKCDNKCCPPLGRFFVPPHPPTVVRPKH